MADVSEICKATYESPDIVNMYSRQVTLQAPEKTILKLLKDELPRMSMLDIGVGGGRTTQYFARLVRKYIGTDYSANMISVCRQKFPDIDFKIADARNLYTFRDALFDFTLFSYNGIDSMNNEDRKKSLSEIDRVTRNEGYICFSTHNLNSVPELLKFQFSGSINAILYEPRRLYRLRRLNKGIIKIAKNEPHLILNDGSHGFRLLTYYVNPNVQVEQLNELGFKSVQVFGLDGREILHRDLRSVKDGWLYFLCTHSA